MQMIMHNGIHYVPATELAKANDLLEAKQERILALTDIVATYREANSEYVSENAELRNRVLDLETATQQLICDIKNKRGVIVDTEA